MDKAVKILSGVSGSGKSTLTKALLSLPGYDSIVSVSVDDYYARDGVYKYDSQKSADAHSACFREFIRHVVIGVHLVIVDHANTYGEAIAPYYQAAESFGYVPEIIELVVGTDDDLQKCLVRNIHSVPAKDIIAQQDRMINRKLPSWWNVRKVPAVFG
jgi:predicted kinase